MQGSGLQTWFKCVLEPLLETTFLFDPALRAFLVKTVVDGFQLSQGRHGIRAVVTRCLTIFILALVFSTREKTYGGGDRRSRLQARSFKCPLEPLPEIALSFAPILHALLIETVVDSFQFSQGRDGIRVECVVIRRLNEFRISSVLLREGENLRR